LCCCFCERCQGSRKRIVSVFRSEPHENTIPMENVAATPMATPDGGVIYTTAVPGGGNVIYTTAPIPMNMGNVIYTTQVPMNMGNVVYAPTQVPVVYTDQ